LAKSRDFAASPSSGAGAVEQLTYAVSRMFNHERDVVERIDVVDRRILVGLDSGCAFNPGDSPRSLADTPCARDGWCEGRLTA
jgi:hypothetical protein